MSDVAPRDDGLLAADEERVLALDRAHVFHSWSAQGDLHPMAVAGAQGSWLWDYDGRRYLDFSSQLVYTNIGHQHPRVVEAVRVQAARLCTIAPQFANDVRGEAAQRIVSHTPEGLDRVFFTTAGADAIENAVRMARQHNGRHKVVSMYRSYHGNTSSAIVATGDPRRWPNDLGVAGHVHAFGPYLYRSPFWSRTPEEEGERALEHLRQVVELEGPGTIAAILLESAVGTAGVLVPPPGYLAGVRELCDRHGIVWIADEVMVGFGRTGSWFAFEHGGAAAPDLVVFAKGVNSGYVPLGGVVLNEAVYSSFVDRPYPGGMTYSGHPLACAAAVATIEVMEDEKMVEHARDVGAEVIAPGLAELAERHPSVGEVRGLGVFWALELVRDHETREMLVPYNAAGAAAAPMAEVVAACRARGLIPITNYNRLHVMPPCNVTADEIRDGLARLDEALSVADRYYGVPA